MRTTGQKTARRERPRQRAPAFRWSWKLVTVAGIDVHIHGTFFLLIAFLALSNLVAGEKVVGLLTVGNIGELLALEAAGHQIGRPAVLSPVVGLRAGAGTS
jgi:hypothetical protein